MENSSQTPASTPTLPPEPTPKGELGWVMQSLNRLETKIDGLDDRLRLIEGRMNKIMGGLVIVGFILVVVQIILKLPNISITFGSAGP